MSDDSKGLNFGLHDQHQALKWIAQNISSFGGDSSRITIAGQSAGAASVHAHVLNARTSLRRPLFRRAIMMSGSLECLGPERLEETEKSWDVLCDKFQVGGIGNERVKKMREIANPQKLVNAGGELGWMAFDSVVDGVSISDASAEDSHFRVSFDRENEIAAVETDEAPIEVLIGETNSEGSVFVADTLPRLSSFTQISKRFHSAYPSSNSANEVLSAYNLTPTSSLPDLHVGIIQFASDVMFGLGASQAAHFLRKTPSGHRAVKVREYSVQYGNPFPGRNFNVAHHCVDLIYGFDAFHDFLAEADEKEAAKVDGAYLAEHSNTNLTLQMQNDWLDFITKENIVETGSEGSVRVYRHDRSVVEESLNSEHWVGQRKRFEVLKKEWGCGKKALWSLGDD